MCFTVVFNMDKILNVLIKLICASTSDKAPKFQQKIRLIVLVNKHYFY